jgi:hypothetical protein
VNPLAKLLNVSLSFDSRQWLKTASPLAPTTSLDGCGAASQSEHIQPSLSASGSELESRPILHFLTDHLERTRGVSKSLNYVPSGSYKKQAQYGRSDQTDTFLLLHSSSLPSSVPPFVSNAHTQIAEQAVYSAFVPSVFSKS